jgi:hypothetical protein
VAAEIRDYDPTTDADAVCEFYNRNQYGPARDGVALTGPQLDLILAERGAHLFLVAEDRGRIIGTIGYLRVSGRRVSGDDELFAGMFMIDPGYRAGFLAGRLFTSSFSRLLEDGVATLRVEVNPANVKAFPLYIRVGFRSADPHPQPDQDGYIELVSHLPGVVSRLLRELASDVPLSDVFASFSWRTMAGGRNRSISHGVTTLDGTALVEYEFTVRGDSIRVTVRLEDGQHVATTINGAATGTPAVRESIPAAPAPSAAGVRRVAVGDYTVEVDACGTVTVRHPRHFGPLYRDALPSPDGVPLATRRPLRHSPLISEHRGGWLLAWQIDDVRLKKEIAIDGDTLTTVVRGEPGRALVAEPWSSVRGAVVRSRLHGSEQFRAPNVPGLCPRDVVDFEASHAAQGFAPHRRTVVDEPVSGIRIAFEWQQAELLRMEGQLLGRATTSGSELRYSVRLGSMPLGENVPENAEFESVLPDGIGWVADSANSEASPAATTAPAAVESRARELRGGHEAQVVRGSGDAELVVVADRGIASWRVAGADVLASPFPSSRTLGPLQNWDACLWVSTQGAREDLEHGVGWGSAPRVAHEVASAEPGPSWSVDVLDDALSTLRLNLRGGRSPSSHEIVAHLTPKVWGSTVSIAAHPSGWWTLDRTGPRWFTFARAARIPLSKGRVLAIAAGRPDDELLIRSSADFFLVSLISRADPQGAVGSWSLSVETTEVTR